MLHRLLSAVLALGLVAVSALAAETKGKIKYLNVKKGTLTITAGEKDVDYMVPTTAKVVDGQGANLKNGLRDLKAGDELTVVTEREGDKEIVKEVRRK